VGFPIVQHGYAAAITAVNKSKGENDMKMKKKRLLGILLSIALVVGLMPGMSLTAYADGETEIAVLPTSAGNYILTADITVNSAWHPADGITLNLGGHSITQVGSNNSDGSVIVVESGRTFTLKGSGNLTGGIGSREGTYYVGGANGSRLFLVQENF